MNILITGSSGFLAKYLIQSLKNKNMVYGIDLKISMNIPYVYDVRKALNSPKLPKKNRSYYQFSCYSE